MAGIGGVTFLFILFAIGIGILFPAIIGFVLCSIYKKKTGHKAKIWIRILLWLVLIAGIVIIVVPCAYFYLIAVHWNDYN